MTLTNAERRTEGQNGTGKTAPPHPRLRPDRRRRRRTRFSGTAPTSKCAPGSRPKSCAKIVDGYDALVVRSETKVTREIIEASSTLQVVGRAGIGVDNIDLQAATEKGVVVVNAPTGNMISAAEHAIALMLSLSRHIPEANASLKSGKWERGKFQGIEVRGKTLGVIGLGQVGSEVARRAKGLEMRVLAHDPFVPEERARVLGVDLVSLDEADRGVRLRYRAHDAIGRHQEPDRRGRAAGDEAVSARDQHRARRHRRRGCAEEGARRRLDRRRGDRRVREGAGHRSTRCSSRRTSS